MDHKTRVMNAVRFKPVDRPPFDMFDECGDLFTDGLYDPALRMGLTLEEQIGARIRFHREFDTDLIFDAPVIGADSCGFTARLSGEDADRFELTGAFFPFDACLWMPWSPRVVPRPGHALREVDNINYVLEFHNGLLLPMQVETASGNPSGYDLLAKSRDEWPLWREVFTPSFESFDYSHVARIVRETRGDVALYGTTACPFSLTAVLLGIEAACMLFLDDPDFARELMEFFTGTVIEVGRELHRHGIDALRIGGAWTSVLGPGFYEQFVLPWHRRMSDALRDTGVLTVLHCCGHVNAMLESFAKAGWDALEPLTPPPLGNVTLAEAKRRVGGTVCLKGNLDPVHVMKMGTRDAVARATEECLCVGATNSGFILSVADCMAPGTPRAHMEIVADIVHRHGR